MKRSGHLFLSGGVFGSRGSGARLFLDFLGRFRLLVHRSSDVLFNGAGRFFELSDRFAYAASEIWKAFGSEEQDEDHQNDDDFCPIQILKKGGCVVHGVLDVVQSAWDCKGFKKKLSPAGWRVVLES